MKVKKKDDVRLVPRDRSEWFKSNPEKYEALKDGRVVTVPSEFEQDVLQAFGDTIVKIDEEEKKKDG